MKFAQSLAVLSLLVPALAQSSAGSSAVASASSAVSAAAPSGTAGASADYLTAVLAALTANNLTGLASVASAIVNTTEGAALLGGLSSGNKTVFAPNNAAFAAVPSSVSSNTQLLTQILSYHILNTTYLPAGIATAPNHTIARTLLYGGNFTLPGNRTAPVVLAKNSTNSSSMFNILQGPSNATAMGPVAAANLQVYVIDKVLSLPLSIGAAATQFAPALAGVAGSAGLLDALSAADGLTVFAPNDAALQAVSATLGTLNGTQIQTVLGNHIINGTVAYSDRLTTSNYTSAAGQPFTFMSNTTGTYVMSGNSSARIIQTDIIVDNGVIHLIDGVLANTQANPSAAASAYASGTSAAASREPTAPVTASSTAAASGASGASASASSSRSAGLEKAEWSVGVMGLGAAVSVVGAMLGGGWVLM